MSEESTQVKNIEGCPEDPYGVSQGLRALERSVYQAKSVKVAVEVANTDWEKVGLPEPPDDC